MAVVGCQGDKGHAELCGVWDGHFEPEVASQGDALRGYLQLYEAGDRFVLHLGTKDQTYDVNGTWTLKGETVTLKPAGNSIAIQRVGALQDRGTQMLDSEKLIKAYQRGLGLKLSADKSKMTSLLLDLGQLKGAHTFTHAERASYGPAK